MVNRFQSLAKYGLTQEDMDYLSQRAEENTLRITQYPERILAEHGISQAVVDTYHLIGDREDRRSRDILARLLPAKKAYYAVAAWDDRKFFRSLLLAVLVPVVFAVCAMIVLWFIG